MTMVSRVDRSEYLDYTHHENGIHELAYKKSSRQAVDAFFSYIESFAEAGTPDDLYLILNDLRQTGHMPLNYYFSKLRATNAKYRPDDRPQARVALVYTNSPLINTINTFVRLLNPYGIRIRIFSDSRYDEAVHWLLSEQELFWRERI